MCSTTHGNFMCNPKWLLPSVTPFDFDSIDSHFLFKSYSINLVNNYKHSCFCCRAINSKFFSSFENQQNDPLYFISRESTVREALWRWIIMMLGGKDMRKQNTLLCFNHLKAFPWGGQEYGVEEGRKMKEGKIWVENEGRRKRGEMWRTRSSWTNKLK